MQECANTSAQNMFLVFKSICDKNSLQWTENLIRQSYDGASNMRGTYSGLQALIKNENSSAVYIWCYAHRLNLVVIDAVKCSTNAINMFGILESVYDFISSSKNRVSLFEECQKQKYKNERRIKRLKRVETTRWWSHDYVLNTVIDTYDALYETLDVLQTENNSNDRKRLHQTASLKDCLTSDWFLLTAFLYKTIFNIITPLSKLL